MKKNMIDDDIDQQKHLKSAFIKILENLDADDTNMDKTDPADEEDEKQNIIKRLFKPKK